MNRKIKFRVYDKTKGYYVAIRDNDCFDIRQTARVIVELTSLDHEFILEQFTGLLDRNGKEIYEGDIVEFGLSGRPERGYVAYADEYASYEVYSKRDYIIGGLFSHAGKVIGNIHENGDLLEKGEHDES